jgi:hypothetical protein
VKLLTTKQYKLDKGQVAGVITAGITLSPAREASSALARKLPTTCAMGGAFKHGINCAVVVDVAKGQPIPVTHTEHGITRPTIDGDVNDLRFQDPTGVYVVLRWKGSKARLAEANTGHFTRTTS